MENIEVWLSNILKIFHYSDVPYSYVSIRISFEKTYKYNIYSDIYADPYENHNDAQSHTYLLSFYYKQGIHICPGHSSGIVQSQ